MFLKLIQAIIRVNVIIYYNYNILCQYVIIIGKYLRLTPSLSVAITRSLNKITESMIT